MRRLPAILPLTAVIALAACRNLDVVTSSYATLDEARSAGAIHRGWVPEGLPAGTTDIREAHDIDTNRRWGLFTFPVEQSADLRRQLGSERDVATISCDIPTRIEWWPVLLRGRLDASQVHATGLRGYDALQGDLVYLVNWDQGRAYYWTLP